MRKFLALALSLSVLAIPAAVIDASASDAEARLRYTQRKCTTNPTTGMTACTTVTWYSNSR